MITSRHPRHALWLSALTLALALASSATTRAQEAEASGARSDDGVTTTTRTERITSATTTQSGPRPAPPPTSDDEASGERPASVLSSSDAPQRRVERAEDRAAGPAAAPAAAPEPPSDPTDHGLLWIEAQGGIANVNLVQFQNRNFADVAGGASVFDEVYGTGPVLGVAAGVHLFWFAIGARANFALYETFQVGTIAAEVTLRFPIPTVEPWIRVGFGYGWQGDANYDTSAGVGAAQTTTYGWVLEGGAGVDIYFARWVSLGAGFGLDVLNMTRQRDPSVMCMSPIDVCPGQDGDALGLQLKGLVTLAFHI